MCVDKTTHVFLPHKCPDVQGLISDREGVSQDNSRKHADNVHWGKDGKHIDKADEELD